MRILLLLFTSLLLFQCKSQNNKNNMTLEFRDDIYTKSELEPFLEKERKIFDNQQLAFFHQFRIEQITNIDSIKEIKEKYNTHITKEKKLQFSSSFPKNDSRYSSDINTLLQRELRFTEYPTSEIIRFYNSLNRKTKLYSLFGFFSNNCQAVKDSKVLQQFFYQELKNLKLSEEEKRHLTLGNELETFIIKYKLNGYKEELKNYVHSYSEKNRLSGLDNFLNILIEDGYEKEAFNHFKFILKKYTQESQKENSKLKHYSFPIKISFLNKFYYSSNFKLRKEAIETIISHFQETLKDSYCNYSFIVNLWKTDVLSDEQRKQIISILIKNRNLVTVENQNSYEFQILKNYYPKEKLKQEFNFTPEQINSIEQEEIYRTELQFDKDEIENDLRFFSLMQEEFNYESYKQDIGSKGFPLDNLFMGHLARAMMRNNDLRQFSLNHYSNENTFKKYYQPVLEKVLNLKNINFFEIIEETNGGKIYHLYLILNEDKVYQCIFRKDEHNVGEWTFLQTMINTFLKEKEIKDRMIFTDDNFFFFLDPGIFQILFEKHRIGYHWQ